MARFNLSMVGLVQCVTQDRLNSSPRVRRVEIHRSLGSTKQGFVALSNRADEGLTLQRGSETGGWPAQEVDMHARGFFSTIQRDRSHPS
jgi:hypothetical protein